MCVFVCMCLWVETKHAYIQACICVTVVISFVTALSTIALCRTHHCSNKTQIWHEALFLIFFIWRKCLTSSVYLQTWLKKTLKLGFTASKSNNPIILPIYAYILYLRLVLYSDILLLALFDAELCNRWKRNTAGHSLSESHLHLVQYLYGANVYRIQCNSILGGKDIECIECA